MAKTYRLIKGSPLTFEEGDNNIKELTDDVIELQAASNLLAASVSCIPLGGLSYLCRMDRYPIMGVNYSATATTITLYDTSTIPSGEFRMDMIYGNTLGNISKRTGTPGTSAAPPDYNPTSEYVLKYILVASGATVGTDPGTGTEIDINSMYVDGAVGDWTFNSLSAKITESTSVPIDGTTSISGINTSSTDVFELVSIAVLNVVDYTQLVFDCDATVAFWKIYFFNGTTLVGSKFVDTTQYRLQDATDPDKYTLGIPFSEFNFSSTTFTKVQISTTDINATWKLDNIRLTVGAATQTTYTIPADSVGITELKQEVLDLINASSGSSVSTRVEMGSSNVIDWSGSNKTFLKTLTEQTDFTDSNLLTGTDTKRITLYTNGLFTPNFPYYWVLIGGTYDNSKPNKIDAELVNGNIGSELVYYTISNNEVDYSWLVDKTTFDYSIPLDMRGLTISPSGHKLYTTNSVSDVINEYDFTTNWDFNTLVLNQSIPAQTSLPQGLFFRPDGLKLFSQSERSLFTIEWDLTTAWDLSTATRVYNRSWTEGIMQQIYFNIDGSKVYLSNIANSSVYTYSLTTAWDLSTASLIHTFDTSSEEDLPYQVSFKPDGLKFYLIGNQLDRAKEYDLTTAWDLSTATYRANKFVESGDYRALIWKPNGRTLILGTANKLFVLNTQ